MPGPQQWWEKWWRLGELWSLDCPTLLPRETFSKGWGLIRAQIQQGPNGECWFHGSCGSGPLSPSLSEDPGCWVRPEVEVGAGMLRPGHISGFQLGRSPSRNNNNSNDTSSFYYHWALTAFVSFTVDLMYPSLQPLRWVFYLYFVDEEAKDQ